MQDQEVYPRRYFYPSLNLLPFLHESMRRPCPVSESLARRVLSLPLYTTLTRREVSMIASSIKNTLAA
jgi:dTDP-4-amino-4,6-dideoxygalactose transaminase